MELPKKEGMRLEVTLASALDSINKEDYDTAISHILEARRSLLDLMFQTVVACECGEAKAIEEKLGKEALHKILATEGDPPAGNPGTKEEGLAQEIARFLIAKGEPTIKAVELESIFKELGHEEKELRDFTSYLQTQEGMDFFQKSIRLELVRAGYQPKEHVTIFDPGKTTFTKGAIVSRKTFEEENQRVISLGEDPATARGE